MELHGDVVIELSQVRGVLGVLSLPSDLISNSDIGGGGRGGEGLAITL